MALERFYLQLVEVAVCEPGLLYSMFRLLFPLSCLVFLSSLIQSDLGITNLAMIADTLLYRTLCNPNGAHQPISPGAKKGVFCIKQYWRLHENAAALLGS